MEGLRVLNDEEIDGRNPEAAAKLQYRADIKGFKELLEKSFGYYEPDNQDMPRFYTITEKDWENLKQLVEDDVKDQSS